MIREFVTLSSWFLLVACLSAGCKTDQQRIQGVWEIVAVNDDAKVVPAKGFHKFPIHMSFSEDGDASYFDGEFTTPGRYTLAPKSSPKQIALWVALKYNDPMAVGIYALHDDQLLVAAHTGNNATQPPADFEGGEGISVMTFRRMRVETAEWVDP